MLFCVSLCFYEAHILYTTGSVQIVCEVPWRRLLCSARSRHRDLSFCTNEEAANIPVKLLDDPEFREEQRRRCAERAKNFTQEAYLERQRELLKGIVGS